MPLSFDGFGLGRTRCATTRQLPSRVTEVGGEVKPGLQVRPAVCWSMTQRAMSTSLMFAFWDVFTRS